MHGVLIRTGRMPHPGEPEYGVLSFDGENLLPITDGEELFFDAYGRGRVKRAGPSWILTMHLDEPIVAPLARLLGHPCQPISPGIEGRIECRSRNSTSRA